jgi:hypothetical protein
LLQILLLLVAVVVVLVVIVIGLIPVFYRHRIAVDHFSDVGHVIVMLI